MTSEREAMTLERFKELLDYDPTTGIFRLRVHRGRLYAGDVAGALHSKGYIRIQMDGQRYFAHRLAWLFMTGNWPHDQIDHINGRRDDNRWCNLREATNEQNQQNAATRCTNTSGFRGVSFYKRGKCWRAEITRKGIKKSLGFFGTPEEAYSAYLAARAKVCHFQPEPRS